MAKCQLSGSSYLKEASGLQVPLLVKLRLIIGRSKDKSILFCEEVLALDENRLENNWTGRSYFYLLSDGTFSPFKLTKANTASFLNQKTPQYPCACMRSFFTPKGKKKEKSDGKKDGGGKRGKANTASFLNQKTPQYPCACMRSFFTPKGKKKEKSDGKKDGGGKRGKVREREQYKWKTRS
ncbi:hypothetical protein EGR_10181 [Echinococcus granulosus]|uniref:Uncharacterized protein n=1 Tax=Echinococcus granulosus TaxID=6210 RepID=W6U1Q4_ECHGR|nr:hypothetical protein EGR_10181 [Echinococcus granulosus]EUB54973.1 hypothetical protein EGR_10181 [Echinococcus granulosus]